MTGTDTAANAKAEDEDVKRAGNPLSQPKMMHTASTSTAASCSSADAFDIPLSPGIDNTRSIQYSAEFRKEFDDTYCDPEDYYDDDIEDDDADEDSQLRKSDTELALFWIWTWILD